MQDSTFHHTPCRSSDHCLSFVVHSRCARVCPRVKSDSFYPQKQYKQVKFNFLTTKVSVCKFYTNTPHGIFFKAPHNHQIEDWFCSSPGIIT